MKEEIAFKQIMVKNCKNVEVTVAITKLRDQRKNWNYREVIGRVLLLIVK